VKSANNSTEASMAMHHKYNGSSSCSPHVRK
jgi:hypothetical protein